MGWNDVCLAAVEQNMRAASANFIAVIILFFQATPRKVFLLEGFSQK